MAQYTISDLQKLTGIKAHTLRVWERRYDIMRPSRTKTNIRYYQDEDLTMLLHISFLYERGHRISEIAAMSLEEMEAKVLEHVKHDSNQNPLAYDGLTYAMLDLDEKKFETIYTGYCRDLGFDEALTEVFFPFLDSLGSLWNQGLIHAGHENFVLHQLKRKLYSAISDISQESFGPGRVLLLLPPHQESELSMLYMEYMIKKNALQCLNLGSIHTLVDLEKIKTKFCPDSVFTIINPGLKELSVEEYIKQIVQFLPDSRLFVTGFSGYNARVQDVPRVVQCIDLAEVLEKIVKY